MSSTQLYYTLKWPKVAPPIVHGVLRAHLVMVEGWLEECLWLAQHNSPQEFLQHQEIIHSATVEERQNFLLSPVAFALLSSAACKMESDDYCAVMGKYAEDIRLQRGQGSGWTALTDREYFEGEENLTTTIANSIIVDFDSPQALRKDLTSSVFSETPLPVSKAIRAEIIDKLSQAMVLIDAVASTAGQLIRNTTRCIRIRVSASENIAAETDPTTIGEMRLLNFHLADKDIYDVADALIHESLHSFLAMYELQNGGFVGFNQTSLVRPVSPWSGNPIPYNAFTHAVYIYFALFEFYKLLFHAPDVQCDKPQVALLMNHCSRGFRVTDIVHLLNMVGESPDWVMMQYRLMSQDVQAYYQDARGALC
ncbi:MAG: hypothetical protein KJ914_13185 [Gammaproteobacteria bacterium]|nr:hypothetical protein [Gammaproteobacteria bacterium]MBU1725390.1 hypothetical protein [Gammaproteobacteria bacterium]MBU2005260.1 hypothetical protein [Gammaproteobacteria bacterium]